MGVSERRQREREERRERIIDAAESVFFGASGYEAATMGDVAAAVELSKGALYLYFKSKEELYGALINRCHRGMVKRLEGESRSAATGLALVEAVAHIYVQFARDYPEHIRLVLGNLAAGQFLPKVLDCHPEHNDLTTRELDVLVGAVERGKRDGSIRPDVDASQLATHVWGGLMGMMMIELNTEHFSSEWPQTFGTESAVPSFIDLILRGIAAAEAGRVSGVA